ncbi:MAG: bifunctional adenosylcobinamide kinase/adenosylcobinamide-phosphate guanylyltransferase [Lachnospiraceae bacterium]|nr:bifunctional adenosylcobinamide kinase/adenosylcobinamide-phosphate guanylyltransferase [Lachnospiraceae bacterium]
MELNMELYIGGYAQGKLEYVMRTHSGEEMEVIDGNTVCTFDNPTDKRVVFNHFHSLIKKLPEQGEKPEPELELFLKEHPNCIIISDEVGNGIVPMEQKERDYRERLGRILITLAARAERVERVICGIGQRIK